MDDSHADRLTEAVNDLACEIRQLREQMDAAQKVIDLTAKLKTANDALQNAITKQSSA